MGNPVSTIRKEARELNDMEKRRMEERLQILEKMVNGRLQKQHSHILTGERNNSRGVQTSEYRIE